MSRPSSACGSASARRWSARQAAHAKPATKGADGGHDDDRDARGGVGGVGDRARWATSAIAAWRSPDRRRLRATPLDRGVTRGRRRTSRIASASRSASAVARRPSPRCLDSVADASAAALDAHHRRSPPPAGPTPRHAPATRAFGQHEDQRRGHHARERDASLDQRSLLLQPPCAGDESDARDSHGVAAEAGATTREARRLPRDTTWASRGSTAHALRVVCAARRRASCRAAPRCSAAMRGNSPGALRPALPSAPAQPRRRDVRRVGLEHDRVVRQRTRQRTDPQRALVRGRAAEPEPEAEREIVVGLLPAAVERVRDAGRVGAVAAASHATQARQHRVLRATPVQQHRQVEVARDLQLLVEEPGLPCDGLGRGQRRHEAGRARSRRSRRSADRRARRRRPRAASRCRPRSRRASASDGCPARSSRRASRARGAPPSRSCTPPTAGMHDRADAVRGGVGLHDVAVAVELGASRWQWVSMTKGRSAMPRFWHRWTARSSTERMTARCRRLRCRSTSTSVAADEHRASPSFAASPRSCVTTTKLVPKFAFSSIISANTSAAVPRSRLPVGSSASTHAGRVTSARASAARWRSPPDSSPGR